MEKNNDSYIKGFNQIENNKPVEKMFIWQKSLKIGTKETKNAYNRG